MIWNKAYHFDEVSALVDTNMGHHIGITLLELGDNFLVGKMPVDQRTTNPLGSLHGGASCVLSEHLASIASFLCVDMNNQFITGLEINANHIKAQQSGFIIAHVKPLHLGRSTHVWDIKINNEENQLICISRMTVAILNKPTTINNAT